MDPQNLGAPGTGAIPATPSEGTNPQAAPNSAEQPLDEKGIKAIQTAIQGAVDSVLSLLQPGAVTHKDVLDKVSAAILALEIPAPLGGLSAGPGLDLESLKEDTGEQGPEPVV